MDPLEKKGFFCFRIDTGRDETGRLTGNSPGLYRIDSRDAGIPTPRPVTFRCSVCARPSTLHCSRCLTEHYCTVVCQKKAWKTHKQTCRTPPPPPPPSLPETLHCSVCSEPSALRCSRCLGAQYCSVVCQKKAWPKHKEACKEAEKLKKAYEDNHGVSTAEEMDAKLREALQLADLGDARAQYRLGTAYLNGLGVEIDKEEGMRLTRLSAENDYADAQHVLGNAYAKGLHGLSVDKEEARMWFKLGAESGNFGSQFEYGLMLLDGDPLEGVQGLFWIKRAAEGGDEKAVEFTRKHF